MSRLLDLGVEPYLVSSSLIGIVAQRLVRRICPDCKVEAEATVQELRALGLDVDKIDPQTTFYQGTGCDKCFHTGYRGRTGIYEIMLISEAIQELIYRQESAGKIKRLALQEGMKTLRMDGARKVQEGITTFSEVLRVTQADIA